MYHNRLEELSQRLQKLIHKLENTDYNPNELEQEVINLDKNFTDLEEKIEKETGYKLDDES